MAKVLSLTPSKEALLTSDTRILKAEEYSELLEFEQLIEMAHRKASEIISTAEGEAATLIERAKEKIREESEQEKARRALASQVSLNTKIKDIESELVSLVRVTIQRFFASVEDGEKIAQMVSSSLKTLRDDHRITVRVPAGSEALVLAKLGEIKDQFNNFEYLEVIEDSSLSSDTCVMESDRNIVRCSFSEQLARLEEIIAMAMEDG